MLVFILSTAVHIIWKWIVSKHWCNISTWDPRVCSNSSWSAWALWSLQAADGMQAKMHSLYFRLNFRQDAGIHHLHLNQIFGEGICNIECTGKRMGFNPAAAFACLLPFDLRKRNMVGLDFFLKHSPWPTMTDSDGLHWWYCASDWKHWQQSSDGRYLVVAVSGFNCDVGMTRTS